jgi:aspartate/tyrosine/aromatic aminotransferase
MINTKESETKVVLKPVCNVICAIFGRSKAKDRDCANCVTLRFQTFGTRLCYQTDMLLINTFLAKEVGTNSFVPTSFAKNILIYCARRITASIDNVCMACKYSVAETSFVVANRWKTPPEFSESNCLSWKPFRM